MIGGKQYSMEGKPFSGGRGGGELLLELGNVQGIPPLYEEIKRKS